LELVKIAHQKARARCKAIGLRGKRGALDQWGTALDTDHLRTPACQRQGEVAEAAEEVHNRIARARVEQPKDPSHQHFVNSVVDLREVRWRKRETDSMVCK